jgi:hypothetical protein
VDRHPGQPPDGRRATTLRADGTRPEFPSHRTGGGCFRREPQRPRGSRWAEGSRGDPSECSCSWGPSGVGKTRLAKELAAFLFENADALIRIDMNEYQAKHSVANLIGAARGYQDSERGGQLSEALRRQPYSVVLLDEIEKAHPRHFQSLPLCFRRRALN